MLTVACGLASVVGDGVGNSSTASNRGTLFRIASSSVFKAEVFWGDRGLFMGLVSVCACVDVRGAAFPALPDVRFVVRGCVDVRGVPGVPGVSCEGNFIVMSF